MGGAIVAGQTAFRGQKTGEFTMFFPGYSAEEKGIFSYRLTTLKGRLTSKPHERKKKFIFKRRFSVFKRCPPLGVKRGRFITFVVGRSPG